MNELKEFNNDGVDLLKLNQNYFYDRLYHSLVEDGIDITYGDFCSRILKNGTVKVLKAMGLYSVRGARENKRSYIHEKLELIINSTIADNKIVSKTIIDLVDGKYLNIDKFSIDDLSLFMALDNDYPHSIDLSKCTYIVFNKHNKLHKIGRSSNVFDRLNSLRNEITPDLELVAYVSNDVEGMLHKEYIDCRKFGEWFELSNDNILDIKNKHNFTILQLLL